MPTTNKSDLFPIIQRNGWTEAAAYEFQHFVVINPSAWHEDCEGKTVGGYSSPVVGRPSTIAMHHVVFVEIQPNTQKLE